MNAQIFWAHWERLYMLEVYAMGPRTGRVGYVYDPVSAISRQLKAHNKEIAALAAFDHMVGYCADLAKHRPGDYRIFVYYWDGAMVRPANFRMMGQGEDFSYNQNAQGFSIQKLGAYFDFRIEEASEEAGP